MSFRMRKGRSSFSVSRRGPRASYRMGCLLPLVILLAIGCGVPRLGPAAAPGADVPWSDYAPGVQSRIDGLAAAKDCDSLQAEFDTADANNTATMNRTDHNNAALMGYIDDKMRAAGCY